MGDQENKGIWDYALPYFLQKLNQNCIFLQI